MSNLPDWWHENERDARELAGTEPWGDDADGYDPDLDDPYDCPDRADGPGHPAEVPDAEWDRRAAESAGLDLVERGLLL